MGQGEFRTARIATCLVAMLALTACMDPDGTGGISTRSLLDPNASSDDDTSGAASTASAEAAPAALNPEMENGDRSAIIDGLLARSSVLQPGPFKEISDAVLAANHRAAEAELRAATLRAEAASLNWLPTLGPGISLNSLGSVVTQLVVDQVLFDNGGKRAERDFAAADVEVAAIALAQDTNDRVLTALDLYLKAETARARSGVNRAAMERMEHFEYVMSERVNAGVSDRADLMIVVQRLNEMRSDMATDRETSAAAMAELNAMSARPLTGLTGVSNISPVSQHDEALAVLKARAQSSRAIAHATAQRAGFLPGISLGGDVGNGVDGLGLSVGAANGIGFGTGASLRAIDAAREGAEARVGQAREDANRRLQALESEYASTQRRAAQTQSLAEQAAANYDIFAQQLQAGRRTVPDAVGVFETKIRTEREAVVLRYELARLQLQIAAIRGSLVDGDQI